MPINTAATGNILDNVNTTAGTNVSVISFTVEGSTTVYTPGPMPVQLVDPIDGTPTGSIVLLPNGTYTFTPAPNYSGPEPVISYTVQNSNGQIDTSSLTIDVLPG